MSEVKQQVTRFAKSQRLLTLATVDQNGQPWTSNVYYSADQDLNLFFVSPTSTNHSQHLKDNPQVSFSIAWFNPANFSDRKAIQGVGTSRLIKSPQEIKRLLQNHYKYFPLWRDMITYQAMRKKLIQSRPYIIQPTSIKYWDDELYGAEGTREINF